MAPITRRRFVRYTAAAAAALRVRPLKALTGERQSSKADSPRAGQLDGTAIRRLASQIAGHVITPDQPDYAASRLIFNRAFDRRPALIVRCASSADIARALVFAQQHYLQVAVRGGGHNRAGLSVCDGGVVIDLSMMNQVEVDAAKRIARAEAGALTVHVDAATQRFGLATTLAGCPTVGIAGLTLGGGEGFLMSKYGAACDNLISAQLVTVDGRQVEASENSNPDLFWAIRGGGGNFAVATELAYRLHPVSDVLAGTLAYPAGRIPDLLHAFTNLVAAAPDEMNVVGQVLPSEQGARFQMLVCHCGDPLRGNELLGPLRALNPKEDSIRVASYMQTNATINPAVPVAHFQTNLFLLDLSAAAVATIATATNEAPPNTRVFIVPFYGAVTRVRSNDTAFALRARGYELDIMGRWVDSADKPRAVQWVTALRDKLRPIASGTYVNQLGETSEELVQSAYGANYSRLVAIKRKYDPNNVLRSNQNVRPA
jgi:FAD binding domain/Berberine and berberine like